MTQAKTPKRVPIASRNRTSKLKKPTVNAKRLQHIRHSAVRKSKLPAPVKNATMKANENETSARGNQFPPGFVAWATGSNFETWWPCRIIDESNFSAEDKARKDFPVVTESTRLVKPFYDEKTVRLVRTADLREYAAHAERMLHRAPPQCALPLMCAHIEALQYIGAAGLDAQKRSIKDAGGLKELLLTFKRQRQASLPTSTAPGQAIPIARKRTSEAMKLPVRKWGTPSTTAEGKKPAVPLVVRKARAQIPKQCTASLDELAISKNTLAACNVADIAIDGGLSVFSSADMRWVLGQVAHIERRGEYLSIELADNVGGVTHNIKNIRELRWRMLPRPEPFPPVSYEVSTSAQVTFDSCIARAKRADKSGRASQAVVGGDIVTKAADFLFLEKPNLWLSDALIFNFGKSLLFDAVNGADRRVCILDPALGTLVASDVAPSLPEGVTLDDVDVILWPVNDVSREHWLLCVAETGTRRVCALDPQSPMQFKEKSTEFVLKIVSGLQAMSSAHDDRYGVERKWESHSPRGIATELNLPIQPPKDVHSCGVLVCLYMWAIIVQQPCPLSKLPFKKLMMTVRTIIGSRLGTARYKKDR